MIDPRSRSLESLVRSGCPFIFKGGSSVDVALGAFGTLAILGFSIFVLIFSITKKKISKGMFIGLLIPLCVASYLALSIAGGTNGLLG